MSLSISIIIPVYNASEWLRPTTEHILEALRTGGVQKAEIIIVNDGSTDNTSATAHSLTKGSAVPIKVVDQPNQGRFLARKTGLSKARYENILFVDSRVYLHKDSLKFLVGQQKRYPARRVWNGHVYVAKRGNIIARFGDAITFIGWRRYFAHPRTCSYGLADFDYYPKGTGCFFAPRELLVNAVKEFEAQTFDLKNSSDDTHLIRIIARDDRINLSPKFACTYHARTKLKQFIRHSFYRGRFFVDGFLRPGNRFFYPLVGFLILSVLLVILCVFWPKLLLLLVPAAVLLWVLELVAALLLGVAIKDALSLFALSPLFTISYGAGIWRAALPLLIKPVIQRNS